MERIWTTELPLHISKPVLLKGWLHHFRQLSMVSFLLVRDAQGIAQVVVDDPALVEKLAHLKHESVLAIQGTVHLRPQAPNGVEIVDAAVDVLVASTEDPPVALYHPAPQAQLPTIMDSAPVTLRHPRLRAAFRLADAALSGYRGALRAERFVEIQTPKIVDSATEGGANVFALNYFGRPAFLAQSPQFYKQTMVGVFERVFEVGPVFRAEPHDTPRHINRLSP